ncbi:MAG: hypothetical protein ACFFD1_12655 [Candidatus Thorarchaeota archaeon]
MAEDLKNREKALQNLLQGNTFKIYWFLLVNGESGVREIQKSLNLSSPNAVSHHLRKLQDSDVVWQNPSHGKYEIKNEIRFGVLSLYTRIGRFLIPQNFFLISFSLSMIVIYFLFIIIPRGVLHTEDLFFLITNFVAIIFYMYQSRKIWNLRPLS